LAHCNFGTEFICARLAKELGVPVLLWGPLDERPEPDGTRLRDTQCGLFATGKVLRRFGVPFTYMTNCRVDDPAFERGLRDFQAVCNVVRTFREARILQIGPRPYEFYSTMCNEGELLERFNIETVPVPLPELTRGVKDALAEDKGSGNSDLELQLTWMDKHFDRDCIEPSRAWRWRCVDYSRSITVRLVASNAGMNSSMNSASCHARRTPFLTRRVRPSPARPTFTVQLPALW
jgi:L-fucose isomerase-like protein